MLSHDQPVEQEMTGLPASEGPLGDGSEQLLEVVE